MTGCPGQELSNSYKEVLVTSALRYVRTQGYVVSLTGSQFKRTYILAILVFCLNILVSKKIVFRHLREAMQGVVIKLSDPGDACISLSGFSES